MTPGPEVNLAATPHTTSVVQQGSYDLRDGKTLRVTNSAEPVNEPFAADRSEEFALDVARDFEAGLHRWLDLNMKGKAAANCGDGNNNRKGKPMSEGIGRPNDQRWSR